MNYLATMTQLDSLSEKYDINYLNLVKCSNKFSSALCSTPETVSGKGCYITDSGSGKYLEFMPNRRYVYIWS